MNIITKHKTTEAIKWVIAGRKFYKFKPNARNPEYYDNPMDAYEECGEPDKHRCMLIQNRCLIVAGEREKDICRKRFGLSYQEVETINTVKGHMYSPVKRKMEFAFDNIDLYLLCVIEKELSEFGNIKLATLGNKSNFAAEILNIFFENDATTPQKEQGGESWAKKN